MYYIFGDIHGCFERLYRLWNGLKERLTDEDQLLFLGDYIDRGPQSYEVLDFLIALSARHPSIFLRGNHEVMLQDYLNGRDSSGNFIVNGGEATIRSYIKHRKNFKLPYNHGVFLDNLRTYYETGDFVAVHAGFRPSVAGFEEQYERDCFWIRDAFFRSERVWEKTVIFGHTPTHYLHGKWGKVFIDDRHRLIGIDTGAVYGGKLTCLVWPTREILQV